MSLSRRSATSSGGPVDKSDEAAKKSDVSDEAKSVKVFFNEHLARCGDYIVDSQNVGNPISIASEDMNFEAIDYLKEAAHYAGFNAVIVVSDNIIYAAAGSGTFSRESFGQRILTAVAAKPQPTA